MKHQLIQGKIFTTKVKSSILTVAAALLINSPAAIADSDISYSYLEAGYFDVDADGADPTGFSFKASAEISDSFFVFAETKQGDFDTTGINNNEVEVDFDRIGYGIGYQSDMTKNSSWFVSYSINEWEIGDGDLDVDTLRIGIRGQLTDNLELNGSLTHNQIDAGDTDDDESGYQIGMLYNMTDSTSFTLNYESIDDVDEASIGIRYSF